MHVLEALDLFLVQLEADGRSMHTVKQYERHVRALTGWLDANGHTGEVERIDHGLLARFLVSPGARERARQGGPKKATSTNALRSSLRCFFRYLHSAGLIREDPARLVRRALCAPPPPRALPEDEERKLLEALDQAIGEIEQRDRVMFRLMLTTGLRVGSLVALSVDDVDLEAGELIVRKAKGDRPHRVYLSRAAAEMLRRHLVGRKDEFLFAGQGGGPLTTRQVSRRLRYWLERAGVRRDASPHALRHTFGTRLYERTGDVLLVKEALGHRSVESTLVYARVGEGRLRAALS